MSWKHDKALSLVRFRGTHSQVYCHLQHLTKLLCFIIVEISSKANDIIISWKVLKCQNTAAITVVRLKCG